jgi:hypothetical protein
MPGIVCLLVPLIICISRGCGPKSSLDVSKANAVSVLDMLTVSDVDDATVTEAVSSDTPVTL